MVMTMIPHLVTGTLPGGLVVQVQEVSPGLIGSNPAVFFVEFSNHSFFPPPSHSRLPSRLALGLPWLTSASYAGAITVCMDG